MEEWVRSYYQAYQDARGRGDNKAIAALCAEDCVVIPPDQSPIKGRQAIEEFYAGPPSSGIEMEFDRVVVSGDTAVVHGIAHWDADGKRQGVAFADVFRRDGEQWLCTLCIWNSNTGFDV
jgi:ketosteroid isomerase-like protein